jgi:molybdopterin-binding protein
MRLSARNVLKGKVKQVKAGAVNTEVVLELVPGVEVVSIITKESADNLQLAPGKSAYAVVRVQRDDCGRLMDVRFRFRMQNPAS